MHSIARRMRQRAFVILNPCEIAGIKSSTALVAFEKVVSLIEQRTADALSYHGPRLEECSVLRPNVAKWNWRTPIASQRWGSSRPQSSMK
jgi:hypothetical protein